MQKGEEYGEPPTVWALQRPSPVLAEVKVMAPPLPLSARTGGGVSTLLLAQSPPNSRSPAFPARSMDQKPVLGRCHHCSKTGLRTEHVPGSACGGHE